MKNVKKSKYFWGYIVLGVVVLLLALALAPFWGKVWENCPWKDLGYQVVSYVIAAVIIVYLILYLFKKIKKSKGTIRLLTIIEFILLALIALGLVVSQLQIFGITNPSVILGLALYIRGVIEVFRAYYYQRSSTTVKYPLGWLVMAILFMTFGVILMVTKIITVDIILYVIVGALGLIGLYLMFYGFNAKPNSVKK